MAQTDTLARGIVDGVLCQNPEMLRIALEAATPAQLRLIEESLTSAAELVRIERQMRPAWTLPV